MLKTRNITEIELNCYRIGFMSNFSFYKFQFGFNLNVEKDCKKGKYLPIISIFGYLSYSIYLCTYM